MFRTYVAHFHTIEIDVLIAVEKINDIIGIECRLAHRIRQRNAKASLY